MNNYYPNFYQQSPNNGFVIARSIEEAMRYPVGPGNAVTFKIENAPVVCEKSQGFSQFDTPRFEVFDLVKRETAPPEEEPDVRKEIDVLRMEIERLKKKMEERNELTVINSDS